MADDLAQLFAELKELFVQRNALILRHPGHANQKVHGNRFGSYGAAKESLRRLKDDKGARERYKATARKRGGGGSGQSDKKQPRDTYKGEPTVTKIRDTKSQFGKTKGQTLKREFDVTREHIPSGLQSPVVHAQWTSLSNKWRITNQVNKVLGETDTVKDAKKIAVAEAKKINEYPG